MFLRKYFILFETDAMIKKTLSFPIYIANIVMEKRSWDTIMRLIHPNYLWKTAVKQIKVDQENLSKGYIFYPQTPLPHPPLLRIQTMAAGSKYSRNYFLESC